jgi:hypothetical protein
MPLQPGLHDFQFSKWGLDFIGPIKPPSSAGHVYILTTIDYASVQTTKSSFGFAIFRIGALVNNCFN